MEESEGGSLDKGPGVCGGKFPEPGGGGGDPKLRVGKDVVRCV